MILLALLLGSDYTIGVKGIGIVNAMEIISIYDNHDLLNQFKIWANSDPTQESASYHHLNHKES